MTQLLQVPVVVDRQVEHHDADQFPDDANDTVVKKLTGRLLHLYGLTSGTNEDGDEILIVVLGTRHSDDRTEDTRQGVVGVMLSAFKLWASGEQTL